MKIPRYSQAMVNVDGEFVVFAQGDCLSELDSEVRWCEARGLKAFGDTIIGSGDVGGANSGRRKVLRREEDGEEKAFNGD